MSRRDLAILLSFGCLLTLALPSGAAPASPQFGFGEAGLVGSGPLLAAGSAGSVPPPPANLADRDLLFLLGAEHLEVSVLQPGGRK